MCYVGVCVCLSAMCVFTDWILAFPHVLCMERACVWMCVCVRVCVMKKALPSGRPLPSEIPLASPPSRFRCDQMRDARRQPLPLCEAYLHMSALSSRRDLAVVVPPRVRLATAVPTPRCPRIGFALVSLCCPGLLSCNLSDWLKQTKGLCCCQGACFSGAVHQSIGFIF